MDTPLVKELVRRRIDSRDSRMAFAKKVNTSDVFWGYVEKAEREPSPALLLRALATLGFDEKDLMLAVDLARDNFVIRELIASVVDDRRMRSILKDGRTAAGLTTEQVATRARTQVRRVTDLERTGQCSDPDLLVKVVKAWGLPRQELEAIFLHEVKEEPKGTFAQQFVTELMKSAGFNPRLSKGGVTIDLGGKFQLEIKVDLRVKQ